MFRTTRLIHDFNMDLAFVFDGKPPQLKGEEIKQRRQNREKAIQEWKQALEKRDYARAYSKAVMTSRLTKSMVEDAKRLLKLLGIPYVQAPSEAEAQAAYMAKRGDVWAASSKDYDCVLFGAPNLVRFLTIHGQEYLPSKGITRPLKPELINLQDLLSHHEITHPQLIDLAILIGTDFNKGIKGVGPKTALKLIKKHGKIENLPNEYSSKISSHFEEVREIYLNPETTVDYDLSYGALNEEELLRFLCDQRNFSNERVETVIHRMKKVYRRLKQASLEKWFRGQT
jgi:flap endonuclease-1